MNLNLDAQSLSIPCPTCGKEFKEKIGRLKTDPEITCGSCGTAIQVEAKELRRGIESTQKSLDDLRRSLNNLFK